MKLLAVTILLLGSFVIGLLFFVRVFLGQFSPRIRQRMLHHWFLYGVWACFGVFSALVIYYGWLDPFAWPPNWLQRREQRETVMQRVQDAGGWEAVRRGCASLVTNYPEGFRWNRYFTNDDFVPIPATFAALLPKEIKFDPPSLAPQDKQAKTLRVVHIWILGGHSTGRASRWFGLEVPCGPGAESYVPGGSAEDFCSNSHQGYRKVSDGVYEVTW